MPDNTPVKTLCQVNDRLESARMVILLQESTLRDLLRQLEQNPTASSIVTHEHPNDKVSIVIEAYRPETVEKSKLIYTKHLTENGWTTTHVNLV